jgi:hypothetical protein
MRTLHALSLAIGITLGALGCGTSKPPQAPTTDANADPTEGIGASSLAPELETTADAMISVDVAGLRANPLLASLLAERERDGSASAMVARLDRIDLRATIPSQGPPALVAVAWGKLPSDPHVETALGVAFSEGKRLASGVKEYEAKSGDVPAHVFVVREGVWVIATGPFADRMRAHFAKTAAPPAPPSGDLVHLRANAVALARAPRTHELLTEVEAMDVALTPGAKSLRAKATFKSADAAKQAEAQLRALTALVGLALAANKDCKALDKLAIDVKHDAKDLVVEVKGIDEAMAAWDPKTCGRSSHHRSVKPRPPPAQ